MKYKSLRGMNDLVGDQAKKYSLVESKIISLVNSYGFDEVRTPLAEVTELFERSIGSSTDIVNKELYSFEDRNNKSISIRPEGTAGVVRALIENDLDRHGIDVWYLGPMYRYERPQKGRLRQFQQFGVESLIDQEKSSQEELIRMELKVIGCLLDIVEVLNIKDFKLEINNIGSSETKKKYSKELVSFLETNLDKLSDTEKNRLSTNPLRILDSKDPITRDILKSAPEYTDFLSKDEKQHLSKLTNAIEENYIKPHIQQNLVRGLDYYSGIVFEVLCNDLGAQNAIAGGGFYSELFEEFGGNSISAFGFAMGIDRLMDIASPAEDNVLKVFVLDVTKASSNFAIQVFNKIKMLSSTTQLFFPRTKDSSLKSLLRNVNKKNGDIAIIVGDEEEANKKVIWKDMKNDTDQELITLDELENKYTKL